MGDESPPDRRSAIVFTARRLMFEKGYEGTKIGDIAESLGISKAAISYYFRRKDEFLDELVEPFVVRLEAVVAENTDSTWPDGVRQLLDVYLGVLLDDVELARWVDTDITLQAQHHFGERLDSITNKLLATITGGSRRKSDKIAALAVLGGLWRPVLEFDAEDLSRHRSVVLDAAMASFPPLR